VSTDEGVPPEPNTTYYSNARVKNRGAYVDGEMHGPWEFYRRDGSLMRMGSFDHGRQVGVWRTFDRVGQEVSATDLGN
jgi:antitoxin component YwqK of YwqJK toxin-antitoxin module